MANKTFALNVDPHEATIGDVTLLFQPEVMGDEFLDAYEQLQTSQKRLGVDVSELSKASPADLRRTVGALRVFLASLMLPESAEVIARWDVVVGDDEVVDTFQSPEAAEEKAAGVEGARVENRSLRLPDRILVQLLEWVVELYGGGAGKRPPTSSTGSSPASRPGGTPGRAVSRSRG
ncbi:hypothetical protein [Streptomyces sp. 2P-4]|uniref:hypothetical protein n=1 Tax=Streptomyces sp. 2P-4 TaxID=2931974 RepID=UPI00254181DA|nr:hypothetical protein [Streptomyces sp. 2P-4]